MTTENLVPIEDHNRLTAGPATWTDTRVPAEVFSIACAVYGTSSEDDAKRVYRTLQGALWKLDEQRAPTRVLTEHSGCGRGAQVDQLSVTLHPGDRVVLEMGAYSAALAKSA